MENIINFNLKEFKRFFKFKIVFLKLMEFKNKKKKNYHFKILKNLWKNFIKNSIILWKILIQNILENIF